MDDKIETHFSDKKMNFNFCHNSKQSYFIKIMKWFYFVFNSCLQGSQIHRSTSKRQCKYLIALRNPQLSIRLRQLINRLAGFIYRSVLPVSFTVKNRKTYISKYVLIFKWLLWDSKLGWRIIMRCFSEWRTIPDKQEKIYLARLGFEPATFGLLVRCSTNWATGQVGSRGRQMMVLGLFDISKNRY